MTIKTSKPIPEFPTFGLLPKEETEAIAFLKKYPEYDGRGTVIAILDTGVDPGAVGLQKTTEGKPKIIDLIDCTGAGDVITKTIVKPCTEEDSKGTLHTIVGLSGRTLIIDPAWDNPSGEFRIGIKRAYELFPKSLITRLTRERRQKFEYEHHQLIAEVQQKLSAWEEAHPSSSTPTESDIAVKTDLEARLEVLKDALKNYDDPGVILDVVVFNDGSDWRVVIDVDESGDLRDAPLLTDYRKELQYHTFSQEDLFNFSVNIYDEGNIVSIVTTCGSHGTHVAAITAAHHPEEPTLNGVAPGAQIVSLKIGDNRLGSMETGAGLARAAISLVEMKCDLANMSYGEASAVPDYGHFISLIRDEVVGKYGCIFVSSAGNSGPALSTTGSPGGTTSDIIGVGAYVSHSMVQAEYALLEPVPERAYTWSSQGPCTDGDIGVTIYAPGGAITSTPTYSLTKSTLMNGTSMSSPNATGCIALLLSGLKAEDKPYTPFRIKNAIINSGKPINENFEIGLLQVQKTWDYLNTYYDREDQDITFVAKITNKPRKSRGIYLREENETSDVQLFSVEVKPKFMREIEPTSGENNSKKFELEMRLALVSTQPWVRSPDFLLLGSQGRSFQVKIDPTQLNPGGFYYSEVHGYDTACPDRGPLFRVPVTVTKPIILSNTKVSFDNLSFSPGHIERRFIKVPDGATFADLTLKTSINQANSSTRLWLHMIQLLPITRFTKYERDYYFSVGQGSHGEEQVEKRRFAVRGGLTIEVCLAQFWSSLGSHTVSLELDFHGVQASNGTTDGGNAIYVNGGEPFTRINVSAPIRREDDINPSITLDVLRRPLRPAEYSLKPLSPDRNTLPNSRRIYSLTLTYKFSTTEKGLTVSPKFPAFIDLLYDSYFEDFFAIVYDPNKKVLGYIDIYPKNIKLETKGDYVIRVQVRHHSQEILEKLNNITCFLEFNLSKKVHLDMYNQISEVFKSNKSTIIKSSLEKGSKVAYFIGSPFDYSTYPKEAKPGDTLVGKLNLVNAATTRVDGGQYSINLVVPPAPTKPKELTPNGEEATTSSEFDDTTPKPEKTKEEIAVEELTEAIRDLQITHLKKFPAESVQRDELLAELEKNHPTHLPVLLTKIDLLLESDTTSTTLSPETANKVLEVADEVLKKVDLTELAKYYGVKQEGNINEAAKKKKKENDDKKKAVVSALRAKAQALAALASDSTTSSSNTAATRFEETYKTLAQWWDATPPTSDFKNLLVYITRERRANRYGNAIKALNKYLSDCNLTNENSKDYEKALGIKIELYKEAGFVVWENYEKKMKFIRIPPGGYAPF